MWFGVPNRRKDLTGTVELQLKELIQETATELNVEIIEMEIILDHVHVLIEVDPQFGVHRAVKAIKGKTSRMLRSEFASLQCIRITLRDCCKTCVLQQSLFAENRYNKN